MVEFAYIHIPFCEKKCKYCAFTSFINLNFINDYINALLVEIDQLYNKEPLKTLYFGGGTPSLLDIPQIEKIITKFNFKNNPEITFEFNPKCNSLNYLKALKSVGINRLSIGFQTFNDKILNKIGRCHNSKENIETFNNARNAGFNNISVDLMYGLVNQTLDDLKSDIDIIKSLGPEHVSTYGLKIEDKTYYSKFTPKNLPDDDMQAKMYKLIVSELQNYNHYEISNFAKDKNFISKHNINYWNIKPYYGFGISASGFINNVRYTNTNSIKKYLTETNKKEEEIKLTKDNLLEETIFLGFRKNQGINISEINQKFNIDFNEKFKKEIEKYLKTGHILKTKNGYRLSLDGILISNYILCDFLMV